jgi:hypothetical protein
VTLLATLGIKPSAPLYFWPIFAGIVVSMVAEARIRRRTILLLAAIFGVLSSVAAFATRSAWLWRIELGWPIDVRHTLLNPMTESSALLLAAGLLCLSHAAVALPSRFFSGPYRWSLALLATLGPLALTIFPYDPLRYYVPFLPAYLLIVLEWFRLRGWEHRLPRRPAWYSLACWALVGAWAVLCLGKAISVLVLDDWPAWHDLKQQGRVLFPWFEIAVLLGALFVWRFRTRLLTGRPFVTGLLLVLSLSTARDLYLEGRFWSSPSYRSREISAEMARLVTEEGSVAGDWAPYFALGTRVKALSMGTGFNLPTVVPIQELRPDFFLFNDTGYGRALFQVLKEDPHVDMDPPVLESEYIGYRVALHPIRYKSPAR